MPTEVYDNKTLDARPDRLDLRDREYRPPLQSLPPSWPLPEDLKRLFSLYTSSDMILNQGSEGACTGFGLAAVINYLFWSELLTSSGAEQVDAAMMKKLKVSKSMLYNMAKIYDEWEGEDYEGSSCRGAMKGWHRHGVCTDETWPYEPGKDLRPKETWSKGVWSEMKENAKYASDRAVPGYAQHGSATRPGGMVILAKQLEKLNKKYKCELHLVGHSAGSILFGYWMDELAKRELKVASLTLYAPACTLAYGLQQWFAVNGLKRYAVRTLRSPVHRVLQPRHHFHWQPSHCNAIWQSLCIPIYHPRNFG